MNGNTAFKDTRLLEVLDHIDESYLAEALEDMKFPRTAAPASGKGKILRSLKYVAAVAACALLMSTLIPVVQYLSENLNLTLPSHTLSETSESPDISSQVVESGFDTESEETIDPIEDTTYLGYLHYDGIEPISEEKMLEVRRAWAEWVYTETYKDTVYAQLRKTMIIR